MHRAAMRECENRMAYTQMGLSVRLNTEIRRVGARRRRYSAPAATGLHTPMIWKLSRFLPKIIYTVDFIEGGQAWVFCVQW